MERDKPPLDMKSQNFEQFYTAYYARVLRYVRKRVRNAQDAEDLVCDTFLYCYDHFDTYDEQKANLATWLYVILDSRLKNYYRDQRESVDFDALENVLWTDDYLERAIERDEARQMVAKALMHLPEIQRKLVILRYFYNCSTAAMAEETGLSAGNVRTTLSRALKKLEKYCHDLGYGKEE